MRAIRAIRIWDLASLSRGVISITRTPLSNPHKLFIFRAKADDSGVDGSFSLRGLPPTMLAAEKEEAKAVLTFFLKKQGLSNAVAARTINRSELFIDHLVSRIHSAHKSRDLVGQEFTPLEIRDALIPYLEEYGKTLVDVVENFPNPPVKEKPVAPVSPPNPTLDSKKLKAVSRVIETGPAGKLPPRILYLMEFGMELEQIKGMASRFPPFAYYSLEGKVKPTVEFLLDLGVPKSSIPTILTRRPQLCGLSLSENIIPTMAFFEKLGVDKKQWPKILCRSPGIFSCSRQKVMAAVDFLYEMGLSTEGIGKILTRCPTILGLRVEDKLRPTAEYFRSLGVDIAILFCRCPETIVLNLETNLKPITDFFLGKGYSIEEIGSMISRFAALYSYSLAGNLMPKWEFFLTMDYSKSELLKFPQYFGYSLEERIKPRYALVKESGVKLVLSRMLSLSPCEFDKALEKKMKKMHLDEAPK